MEKVTAPQLYDAQGMPADIPEDQIPQALASGKFGYPKGTMVPVISPSGVPGTVPAEEAANAFTQGFSYEPLSAQQQRAEEAYYGGMPTSAALAGAARGISLGLSDVGLVKSGIVDAETLEKLKEHNAAVSTGAELAAIGAATYMTGGGAAALRGAGTAGKIAAAAAKMSPAMMAGRAGEAVAARAGLAFGSEAAQTAAAKVLASVGARAAGSAVEGALYSGGAALSEAALGDPDHVAESLFSMDGLKSTLTGAVIGAGIGGFIGKFEASAKARAAEKLLTAQADRAALQADLLTEAAKPATEIGAISGVAKPDDVSAFMGERLKGAKFAGITPELPQKAELLDSVNKAGEYQLPVLDVHVRAMDDPATYDKLRILRESDTKQAKELRMYESAQKSEGFAKLKSEVNRLAPGYKPTPEPVVAGSRLVDALEKANKAEDAELAPLFKRFDEAATVIPVSRTDLINTVTSAMPEVGKVITIDPKTDKLFLEKYAATAGIAKETYPALREVVAAANKGDLTLSELRNLRREVSGLIKYDMAPIAKSQLQSIKSNMMDAMIGGVEKSGAPMEVRDFFKRYAINKQNRQTIEKVLGGNLSDEAGILKTVKRENVMDSIFTNTNTVEAAKSILGKEEFNKALADHLAEKVEGFTKDNAFSSNKFGTFLRGNEAVKAAFIDNPDVLERIQSVNTIMRLIPDSAPINNSGTAKTIVGLLASMKDFATQLKHEGVIGMGSKWALDKLSSWSTHEEVAAFLAGREAPATTSAGIKAKVSQYVQLASMEEAKEKVKKATAAAVAGFFGEGKRLAVPYSVEALDAKGVFEKNHRRRPEDRETAYRRRLEDVSKFASDPELLIKQVADSVGGVSAVAPQVGQALTTQAMRATSFLLEKIPKDPTAGTTLMGHQGAWRPSDSQLAKFERYTTAVEHPDTVLKDFRNGTITREAVEAYQTVYPKMYGDLVHNVIDHISDRKKPIPYSKRLQLGVLLQSQVDQTMSVGFLTTMQGLHGTAQAQEAASNEQATKPVNMADKAKTGTEKVLTRG